MAYTKTEDDLGRQVTPIVGNESEDGTGTWHALLVDTSGRALISHDKTGIAHGVKTVTSAGTHEPLVASSTPAKRVICQAQTDNANGVAVGGDTVDATVATGNGILLYAGDWTPWIEVDDLADVYVDSLASGEGVRFIYET